MLGYSADDEALAWWENSDVTDVIAGIMATDRYRERCAAIAAGRSTSEDHRAQGAWRLHIGRGLSEITPSAGGAAGHELLRLFPWATFEEPVADGRRPLIVRTLGRYAIVLAREIGRRQPSVAVHAGIEGSLGSDVLVFTGHDDVLAAQWGMPGLVQATAARVIAPLQVSRRREQAEALAVRTHLRDTLHGAGFTHVRELIARRFGGGLAVLAESFAGAIPGVVHEKVRGAVDDLPSSSWFVADRSPIGGGS